MEFRTRVSPSRCGQHHPAIIPRQSAVISYIQVVHLLFGHQGLFGIQGKHYVTIFLLKESVQMVLRSHQASKLSAVVARPALVRAIVALVILQCCSTPFIHRRFGHAGGQERMWYVFCDVFMCFITTIVIPAVLAIPYLSQYDPQTRNFPIHSYQSSVWFSVMVTELQRILVTSWVDVITRIFMSLSILASLGDAKLLLARPRRCLPPQPGQVSPPKRSKSITQSPSFRMSFLRRQNSSVRRAKQSLEQVLNVVMFIFGVAVFIVHLRVELHGHETSCVLPVRPWLSAKAGCTLFVLNCTKESMQGGLLDMNKVLASFEARTLQTLELVSCPQLHVPPIIQSFHQLANFKILSSNVTSWDVDAALTAANHPRLISFAANNVNMPGGELPLGMQDPHFPPTLRTLHLSGMNVQTLPITLPSVWPQAMFLMYEFCNLTVVPPVLTRMSFIILSLAGNQLTDVPPELFYVMPLLDCCCCCCGVYCVTYSYDLRYPTLRTPPEASSERTEVGRR